MRWSDYKLFCDRPDYQSRWMIEQTVELAEKAGNLVLQNQLTSVLETQPLEMPSDHIGGRVSEMYKLELCLEVRRQICELIVQAKQSSSTSTSIGKGLAGFEEAWTEYHDYSG